MNNTLIVNRTEQKENINRTKETTPLHPTVEGYQDFELAFDFFGRHLFKRFTGFFQATSYV